MHRLGGGLPANILERIRMRRDRAGHAPSPADYEQPGVLVASYNVHKCVGTDGRFDPERTAHVIREIDADVIALQEADKRFGDRNGLLDLTRLQSESGLTAVPVSGQVKAHGWHGNVVLFRRGSVRDVHQIRLPGLEPRGAVIAEIELEAGGTIRIVAAHFGLLRRSRTRQVRAILDIMKDSDDIPTLLMGDLNEWRLNGRSALTMFETAFGELPPAVPSFPSRLPLLALDRLISNRKEILSPVLAHDTPLARLASDHLPIKAWVNLARARSTAPGDKRVAA
ncbi:endonuclease/exonuclease/phosphatase family protein [Mesorhizobium retamae]|uniref:Endonuclease/exonuclease/phosphatase family protein n=1 Tax=Mesorhizobium retamae TaxID=2912854 RepID=A0ABS9QMK1_9HYPH|nr:endonuclease/exonuclease/phosphatase family protein [Mesorhizobium sp. IRAMC:0171]MCG7508673.1 endonuclease/exonuclease/phosphatase family protein [Mesorhizobium sp. IRAMC:0171]